MVTARKWTDPQPPIRPPGRRPTYSAADYRQALHQCRPYLADAVPEEG
jgi:hypothetical protein